ncbi:leucine Rich repeat-containing domain protein [Dictyocaulus viviparus]|uniref:Leucine Rich repeat-containing domain protein n=1 Tax=Dictyocaulus viviparus TaxID=29172 RepID=A0A0D8XEH8_DICVI|nr:leucine Rich repeat-containing domain protein [Dictyocaulus viviparus]
MLLTLPNTVPSGFEVLIIRNASVRSIPKLAFRRMDRLKEIHVDSCDHLTFLEKFAFKGMKRLRKISFTNCPRLNEISKSTFSGIGNEFGVKIHFHQTPVQRIHSGAFRHASNIRELSISGSDLALSRHAFASINQLDFLTVSGVTVIEPQLFTNSTRFHIVHLKELNCEIPPRAFEDLAHVHQPQAFYTIGLPKYYTSPCLTFIYLKQVKTFYAVEAKEIMQVLIDQTFLF